ncbi:SIR2-like protein [Rhodobacter viridis]|uniref:SIR2-like protein n=2 Tax=Rhodobacter viridis TaxID=1054202 RepID=A0A318TY20_9RHOB|nr:SIR2-like protein [Rhodobacter viridis]
MAGDVVFLCGTGISAPQLPDFKSLVDQTYARLGVEMNASEQRSYDSQRFEEVLGALGRRLADPEAMVRTASELLAVPAGPRLDHHRTVLRLSRDLSNRVLTVTTNFDTLLERALGLPAPLVRSQSFAGQSLPAPGGAGFSGVIHIHGRLVDPTLDLDPTPLVLTSADYGDAYMRSGWASRFLFDLARCKTIVLIGYSANDAPVRYFLNVLEADRARFPDLRPVYAFDAYGNDPVEAEAGWGTLAVTPLTYCKLNPVTGVPDHSPLWDDLHRLANIIERPKRSREERARQILIGDSRALTYQRLRELSWLFTDRSDLWPVALDAITDPGWFRVLHDNNLWSARDATWVISNWISRDFEAPQCFTIAVEWHAILGCEFLARLDQRLRQAPPASPFWLKAWRILLSAGPAERADDFEENAFAIKQRLASGVILDCELAQSVTLLAPVLVARRPWQLHENVGEEVAEAAELRLSRLVALDFQVIDEYEATEIIEALDSIDDYAVRILELGSEVLRSSLHQAVDLGMIIEDYDTSDYSVPSVEDHGQNAHHSGVIFLVRATVNAFSKAVAVDSDRARAQAAQWRTLPGRMGTRLMLHAARDAAVYSADEALQLLLELEDTDFWIIRREFALALRDRAAHATPSHLAAVEARIRTSGDAYYARYLLKEGQVDWRAHARDSAVWLRLKMLDAAGVLSEVGRAELHAIVARRPHLDRAVEDSDFFSSYIYSGRAVVGDSEPIAEPDTDDHLKVAAELSVSPDIDRQMGWRSYCRLDPRGAFEALAAADLTAPNVALWDDLLAALAFRNDEKDAPLRNKIAIDALAHLEELDMQALQPIAASAVDLLMFGPRRLIRNLEDWCDRLWHAVKLADHEINFEKNLYETAINRAAGRLTQILLEELNHTRMTKGPHEVRQRARLAVVASDDSEAGITGRAVLIHDFAFILLADAVLVEAHLLSRLLADTDEARGLRAVLVSHSSISPEVTMVAPGAVLRGVVETRADCGFAAQIASGILRPALASVSGDEADRWGIGEADVGRALREAPLKIRTGTLNVLVSWMHNDKRGAEEAWEKMVAPFFDRVWPKERRFVDDAHNRDLMAIAVGSGRFFPEAVAKLRPFFSPYARARASVHPIKQSEAPEAYPHQVLDLLWLIFGPTGSSSYDMADILDRLVAADPSIEIDRRYQSLEQRTIRLR